MKKKIKNNKKIISFKYIQADSSPGKIDKAFDILFEETLKIINKK